MKSNLFFLPLSLLFLLQSACDISTVCDGTASITYNIGEDVDADFTATPVEFEAEILTSSCSSLEAGQTANDSLESISRSGDTLTLSHEGEEITATISDGNVSQFSRDQEVSGCSISLIMTGELDSTGDRIITTGEFTAEGVTCNPNL